ncbi:MAG: hypothetical protein JST26_14535 [Bacteroidetes bacterium]|nr:hypothetical protein [Bacteroidota bacterium]
MSGFKTKLLNGHFLLFFIIAFILYGNTLRNGYSLDDNFVTIHDVSTKGLKSIKKIFTSYYVNNDGGNVYEYRPVVKVSFAIEHQFFGVRPEVSHFFNILLYAVCIWILFKALKRLFSELPITYSLLVALLFAVLPVHSEVVASLKNRDVMLCFIFSWWAFLMFDEYFNTQNLKFLCAGLFLTSLAFLSKLDALPYLALFPLLFYKRYGLKPKLLMGISLVFFIGLLLARLLKRMMLEKSEVHRVFEFFENPLVSDHSFASRLIAGINSLGFYAKMLIFPSDMSCYYGYDTIPVSNMFSFYALLGILVFAFGVWVFIKYMKPPFHPLWAGVVFLGISISMYLNIVKLVSGIVAERFLFFASIGFCIAVVYFILTYINRKWPSQLLELNRNTALVLCMVACICGGVVIQRNKDWKDKITLFETDMEKYPGSVKLNTLYASEVLADLANKKGTLDKSKAAYYIEKSEKALLSAVAADSTNVNAYNNLAFIRLNGHKDYAGSIPYLKKAYYYDTTKFEVIYNLAFSYYKTKQYELAEKYVFKAFRNDPESNVTLDLISQILVDAGKTEDGIQFFKNRLNSGDKNNRFNIMIANFYMAEKDTLAAKNYYKEALKEDPNNRQLSRIVDLLSE